MTKDRGWASSMLPNKIIHLKMEKFNGQNLLLLDKELTLYCLSLYEEIF